MIWKCIFVYIRILTSWLKFGQKTQHSRKSFYFTLTIILKKSRQVIHLWISARYLIGNIAKSGYVINKPLYLPYRKTAHFWPKCGFSLTIPYICRSRNDPPPFQKCIFFWESLIFAISYICRITVCRIIMREIILRNNPGSVYLFPFYRENVLQTWPKFVCNAWQVVRNARSGLSHWRNIIYAARLGGV